MYIKKLNVNPVGIKMKLNFVQLQFECDINDLNLLIIKSILITLEVKFIAYIPDICF